MRRTTSPRLLAGPGDANAVGGPLLLTIPKRLRAYCLHRRASLGDLALVAARTVTAAGRATTGEAGR